MRKYSNELNLSAINYYLDSNGYQTTTKYFNIPSFDTVL